MISIYLRLEGGSDKVPISWQRVLPAVTPADRIACAAGALRGSPARRHPLPRIAQSDLVEGVGPGMSTERRPQAMGSSPL